MWGWKQGGQRRMDSSLPAEQTSHGESSARPSTLSPTSCGWEQGARLSVSSSIKWKHHRFCTGGGCDNKAGLWKAASMRDTLIVMSFCFILMVLLKTTIHLLFTSSWQENTNWATIQTGTYHTLHSLRGRNSGILPSTPSCFCLITSHPLCKNTWHPVVWMHSHDYFKRWPHAWLMWLSNWASTYEPVSSHTLPQSYRNKMSLQRGKCQQPLCTGGVDSPKEEAQSKTQHN